MAINSAWKSDNIKFVGKAFHYAYKDRLNRLMPILGEVDAKSETYQMTGLGGYGEMEPYDGVNLNMAEQKRGFRTIITPEEFSKSAQISMKAAKIDKLGETKRAGKQLGDTAALTVYLHALRMFGGAFDPARLGGDGCPWASDKHPIAALREEGRKYIPDPDAGTYSNIINEELSAAAITKAQGMAGRFVTPDGVPFLCEMDTLLVSPELEGKAKELLGDMAKLRPKRNPDDNTNAANPLYDMNYIVVGGGRDGFQGKQWAICDRRLMQDIVKIVYITRPDVFQNKLDNPLIDQFTAYADFGVGWGDARQIIFSRGKA